MQTPIRPKDMREPNTSLKTARGPPSSNQKYRFESGKKLAMFFGVDFQFDENKSVTKKEFFDFLTSDYETYYDVAVSKVDSLDFFDSLNKDDKTRFRKFITSSENKFNTSGFEYDPDSKVVKLFKILGIQTLKDKGTQTEDTGIQTKDTGTQTEDPTDTGTEPTASGITIEVPDQKSVDEIEKAIEEDPNTVKVTQDSVNFGQIDVPKETEDELKDLMKPLKTTGAPIASSIEEAQKEQMKNFDEELVVSDVQVEDNFQSAEVREQYADLDIMFGTNNTTEEPITDDMLANPQVEKEPDITETEIDGPVEPEKLTQGFDKTLSSAGDYIHQPAIDVFFGSDPVVWQKDLFKARRAYYDSIGMSKAVSYALAENKRIVDKYSVDILVPKVIHTSGEMVIKENEEILQLFFASKGVVQTKAPIVEDDVVSMKLGDLLEAFKPVDDTVSDDVQESVETSPSKPVTKDSVFSVTSRIPDTKNKPMSLSDAWENRTYNKYGLSKNTLVSAQLNMGRKKQLPFKYYETEITDDGERMNFATRKEAKRVKICL